MIEPTISRNITLSNRYLGVKVSMTLLVDFQPPEYSVEVSRPPSLIPIELIEPLWSNGINSGVLQAVDEANYILAVTGIYIKIQTLEISEPLIIFDEDEIRLLGNALKIMTYETLYPIFYKKGNSAG